MLLPVAVGPCGRLIFSAGTLQLSNESSEFPANSLGTTPKATDVSQVVVGSRTERPPWLWLLVSLHVHQRRQGKYMPRFRKPRLMHIETYPASNRTCFLIGYCRQNYTELKIPTVASRAHPRRLGSAQMLCSCHPEEENDIAAPSSSSCSPPLTIGSPREAPTSRSIPVPAAGPMQKDKVPELAPGVAKRSKKAASALSKVRPHRSWTRSALHRIQGVEALAAESCLESSFTNKVHRSTSTEATDDVLCYIAGSYGLIMSDSTDSTSQAGCTVRPKTALRRCAASGAPARCGLHSRRCAAL